jgi:alkanesulfonate monooxygenase SsuD/methylene tetrahydromethanopterin reductase-like flavin-dependent oxidoreductase (luciferase family)
MTTRLGFQIPNFTFPGVPDDRLFERVASMARAAEESGFDTVLVMDHFYQLPMLGSPENAMLEAYTLLGALAARTRTARLGALVREAVNRSLVLGDPDAVGDFVQTRLLGAGLDGLIVNLPADGHDPEAIALAGETLRKALG